MTERSQRVWLRPGVLIAVGAGIVALVVLAYASQPRGVATTTTTEPLIAAPPEPVTTASTSAGTGSDPAQATLDPSPPTPLTELLPGAEGTLFSVVTTGTGTHRLLAQSDVGAVVGMPPMLSRPLLEFDAADLRMAFLGPSSVPRSSPLYVGRPLNWDTVASVVTSFAWHTNIPGRLGWIELDRGFCQADVKIDGALVSEPACDLNVEGELVGLDETGALVVDGGEVLRVSASQGERIGSAPGIDAFPAPDGRVLITSISSAEQGFVFDLATPDLGEVERLEWAPANVLGLYGFVAWSPRATSPELAFLVRLDDGKHQIQRWDLNGNLLTSLNLGGEVWDIKWDRSGRFLLAPGLANGEYVVHVYDVFTHELTFLAFDHWVEDTHLTKPAECESAAHLTVEWQGRMADDAAVDDLWMVLSRDSDLISWRFLSGRVFGGAHDGEIATWAIPVYSGAGAPPQAVAANDAAVDPDRGPSPLDQDAYGIDDWMVIDGARISQWCVETMGG